MADAPSLATRALNGRYAPFAVAGVACALVLSWWALTVRCNYAGDWTALFWTGERAPLPPDLEAGTWRFDGIAGYDGQYYRLIARDPLMEGATARYVDSPQARYRRILVPGAAALASFGDAGRTDAAYRAVILFFLGFGVFQTALLARSFGRSPAFGLLFLLLPAAVISIDRLTVDVALSALTAAYLLQADRERRGVRTSPAAVWSVLAAAMLARETGVALAIGQATALAVRRRFTQAVAYSAAALPALAWALFVAVRHPGVRHGVGDASGAVNLTWPLAGWARAFDELPVYAGFPDWVARAAAAADFLALLSVPALLAAVFALWRRRPAGAAELGMAVLATIGLCLSELVYRDVFAYPRVLSSLYLFAGLTAMESRNRWAAAALVPVLARVPLQLAPQLWGVSRCLGG